MKKREFKKMLRKEKNLVIRDEIIAFILCMLSLPYSIMNVIGSELDGPSEGKLLVVSFFIYLIGAIIAILLNIIIGTKIQKMYNAYKENNDYKNIVKPISRLIMISLFIFATLIFLVVTDFRFATITKNKPLLSIKSNSESLKYSEKYSAIFYDYYKTHDESTYFRLKNKDFKRDYADRIIMKDYIDRFNKNLKLYNLGEELKLEDYIYTDGQYIWIIDENNLELRIILEEGKINNNDIHKKGNVKNAYLVSFESSFKQTEFDKYIKAFIMTDTTWYSKEDVDSIYEKASKGEYIHDGILYEASFYKDKRFFWSCRILKDSIYSSETYVHTSLNNLLEVTLPDSYQAVEQEDDKYELFVQDEETGALVYASYYLKDRPEYFYMTPEDAVNKMVDDCNNTFTDIEKVSDLNTIFANKKQIKEVVYKGIYKGNKVTYKISGFNLGKTNEYVVAVAQVINEKLYEEKKEELDSIRNSIKDSLGSIYIGAKVKNEEAIYIKTNIENVFKINMPMSFNKLTKEQINKIQWSSNKKPEIVYSNKEGTVLMSIEIGEKSLVPDVDEYVEEAAYTVYTLGGFIDKDVKNINGRKIGKVVFTLDGSNTITYCHIMFFKKGNNYVRINFSVRRDLMSKWNWVAEEIMESIE